ncbi:calcium/sodium antiporter [Pseudohoeflea coraliihabitans]|uniref:Calcium/sodium antiporter n=1 Tax=Pseudohoeflea coraliihabitans TaxID=2860393 RepID=A0ABS6WRY9_9HYPH|nr:calcium/sodium antiporter [Pseudohoeflea sp. DP4N28-3]MBW3098731.1 calcium/sodium antiporter [Pseudohoeflea sp. DP4N28-3]
MLSIITLIAGLAVLILAGDYLVRGSVGLAARMQINPLIIGLTVVAFGTSAPELFVSLQAAFDGVSGIAIGNVVGSNIANVLLVLGVPALLSAVSCSEKGIGVSLAVMMALSALLMVFMANGTLTRLEGAALLVVMFGYIGWQIHRVRVDPKHSGVNVDGEIPLPLAVSRIVLFIAGGLIGLPIGAWLTVLGASEIARMLGASDTAIGLTVVAIGTSLPELVTTVAAAWRRSGAVAIGNVVGSNIFNIGFILGVTGLVLPLDVDARIIHVDMWVMFAASGLVVALAHWCIPLKKLSGGAMLLAFALYIFTVF